MWPAAGSTSTQCTRSERQRPTPVRIGDQTGLRATAEMSTDGCLPTSPVTAFHHWSSLPRLPAFLDCRYV